MRVLMAGNTGYITNEFLEEAFPESKVMVLGNKKLKTLRKKGIISRPFPESEQELADIFRTYEFEAVVYFSNYLTFHGEAEGEAETIRKILQYCKNKEACHILYLTGPEALFDKPTGKTLLVRNAEDLCLSYARMYGLQLKIVRMPYLYSAVYEKDYICKVFSEIQENGKIVFKEGKDQQLFFLCSMDLARLLYKLYDNWDENEKILEVPAVFKDTVWNFGEKLEKLEPHVQIIYENTAVQENITRKDPVIRQRYGWFPVISMTEELSELYGQYREARGIKPGKLDVLKRFLNRYKQTLKIAEFVCGFMLFQILNHMAGNQAQFKMIDLRVVFIVIFGSLYGLNYGIAAAAAESVSLLGAYAAEGNNWYTLFYEPSNWIPFIFYFTTGAVCGYVRRKNKENTEFVMGENKLIQEKFLFMRQLYQETLQDKRMYKKQILGSQDSFGKIFEITRKLDVIQPQELFLETMKVFEEVLENKTFAVYSLSQKSGYGRLEAVSSEARQMYTASLNLKEYQMAVETLEKGEIWVNKEYVKNYPMYMAGVRRDGELVLLICIQEAKNEQMTLYYKNLFQILCGLVETSLLRALEYQEATQYQKYIKGTHILKQEYFEESLKVQHTMREEKFASYILLQLKYQGMTLEEADQQLDLCVRENDIRGVSGDGELYLILVQADHNYLPFILKRLERAGFTCRSIDEPLNMQKDKAGESK